MRTESQGWSLTLPQQWLCHRWLQPQKWVRPTPAHPRTSYKGGTERCFPPPLTVGGQDVVGLAARPVAAGHHWERDGELDVEELQTLLLGRQRHDLLLEPLVLLLQRVQSFEHLYNCRDGTEEGEEGRTAGRRWGTEGRGEGGAQRGTTIRAQRGKVGPQNAAPLPAPPRTTAQRFIPSLAPFLMGKPPPPPQNTPRDRSSRSPPMTHC